MAKLPMKAVEEDSKFYNIQEKIEFPEDDGNYEVNFYPFFKKERVEKVVENLSQAIQDAIKQDIDVVPDTKSFVNLAIYFGIKEFTDISTPKNNTKRDIQYYKTLYNSKYWDAIVEAIPESEFAKIVDLAFKVIEEAEKLTREVEEMQNEIQTMDFKSKEFEEHVKGGKQIPEQ